VKLIRSEVLKKVDYKRSISTEFKSIISLAMYMYTSESGQHVCGRLTLCRPFNMLLFVITGRITSCVTVY